MKTKKLVFYLTLLAFVFAACSKKEDMLDLNESQQKAMVEEWLNTKIGTGQGVASGIIKDIKANIEMSNSWLSDYREGEKILVIPISKNCSFVNNKEKNTNNYLVLFKTDDNKINNGYIWQTLPGTLMTKNSISNIYKEKNEELNGTYVLLNLRDNFVRQYTYESNIMKEMMQRKAKPQDNNRSSSGTLVCTDYYVLRTTFNTSTGEIIGQEVLYSFQVCNCQPSNTVQTTLTGATECDPSTDGGGGVFNAVQAEEGVTELMSGAVFSHTTNLSLFVATPALNTHPYQFKCGWGGYWDVWGNAQLTTSKNLANNITVHSITCTSSWAKQIPGPLVITHDIDYTDAISPPAIINSNNTTSPTSIQVQRGVIRAFVKIPGYSGFGSSDNVTGTFNVKYQNY
jgi:hypothetical protein